MAPEKVRKAPVSNSVRAGLQFPVARILHTLRKGYKGRRFAKTIQRKAAVYMAASLEYLVAEIMELAGNSTRDNKRRRITPRDIYLGVHNDDELSKLLSHVTIASGGTKPNVHPVLLAKRSKAKSLVSEGGSSQSGGRSKTSKSPAASEEDGRSAAPSKKRKAAAPAADEEDGPRAAPMKKRKAVSGSEGQSEEF